MYGTRLASSRTFDGAKVLWRYGRGSDERKTLSLANHACEGEGVWRQRRGVVRQRRGGGGVRTGQKVRVSQPWRPQPTAGCLRAT